MYDNLSSTLLEHFTCSQVALRKPREKEKMGNIKGMLIITYICDSHVYYCIERIQIFRIHKQKKMKRLALCTGVGHEQNKAEVECPRPR